MRRYTLVSGLFFTLLMCMQLLRLILRWPVQVAGVDVPLWISGLAAAIVGSLAVWGLRSLADGADRGRGHA